MYWFSIFLHNASGQAISPRGINNKKVRIIKYSSQMSEWARRICTRTEETEKRPRDTVLRGEECATHVTQTDEKMRNTPLLESLVKVTSYRKRFKHKSSESRTVYILFHQSAPSPQPRTLYSVNVQGAHPKSLLSNFQWIAVLGAVVTKAKKRDSYLQYPWQLGAFYYFLSAADNNGGWEGY